MRNDIYRIIDCNINRSKEALRVCEDITRFILNSPRLTSQFKKIRHSITTISQGLPISSTQLLKRRESEKDVGKKIHIKAKKRDWQDVFLANVRRAEEAIRVLEEFSKVVDEKTAMGFQEQRFKVYTLEKKVIEKRGQATF